MNPKISIILPTYNGSRYIKRSIESVLVQTFLDWELIIIDDGSVDSIKSIIEEYPKKETRIIYIKNKNNLGIQKSLNKGLREAKGEYIARIDDDDEWIDKDKLKKQIEFLENNIDYVLVGMGVINVNEQGKELFRYLLPETDENIRNKILSKNCFIHSSVMFKKDVALDVGGYGEGEEERHIEDYDLWLKIGMFGKFYNLPRYSINFTVRVGSISSNNKLEQFKKNLNLIKKYKNKYPNYKIALFLRKIIFLSYKIFNLILNSSTKNKLIKIYKKL